MLELKDPIKEYERGVALGRGQGRYDDIENVFTV